MCAPDPPLHPLLGLVLLVGLLAAQVTLEQLAVVTADGTAGDVQNPCAAALLVMSEPRLQQQLAYSQQPVLRAQLTYGIYECGGRGGPSPYPPRMTWSRRFVVSVVPFHAHACPPADPPVRLNALCSR